MKEGERGSGLVEVGRFGRCCEENEGEEGRTRVSGTDGIRSMVFRPDAASFLLKRFPGVID